MKQLLNIFKKKVKIPSYHEKRSLLDSYRQKYSLKILIETGTFFGETVDFFRTRVDKVYSIELSTELAEKAQKRFADFPNVKIIQGNSGTVLADIIKEITQPALFWLDGHYSSEFYVGDEFIRTAKGEKETPIENELDILMQSELKHVILIDDARLFVGKNDYPTIKQIEKIAKKSKLNYQVSVESDIIILNPH